MTEPSRSLATSHTYAPPSSSPSEPRDSLPFAYLGHISEFSIAARVCKAWHARLPHIVKALLMANIMHTRSFDWDPALKQCQSLLDHQAHVTKKPRLSYADVAQRCTDLVLQARGDLTSLNLEYAGFIYVDANMGSFQLLFSAEKGPSFPQLRVLILRIPAPGNEKEYNGKLDYIEPVKPTLSDSALENVRRHCPQLRHLTISNARKRELPPLLKAPDGACALDLQLGTCRDDLSPFAGYTPELNAEFDKFKSLSIRCGHPTLEWGQSLVDNIKTNKLVKLELDDNSIYPRFDDRLIFLLSQFLKNLRTLILNKPAWITNAVIPCLTSLPKLQRLEINGCFLKSSVVRDYAKGYHFTCEESPTTMITGGGMEEKCSIFKLERDEQI